jgi:acyl-CoA synthetase (AMP-forming)/AMP-acid ligase II
MALLDDDGKPVPVGEPGELYVQQFSGILDEYYKDPPATAGLRAGRMVLGGRCRVRDADGFYYICDRKRDMIISAGVNIYPAEIEDALHRHPTSRTWPSSACPTTNGASASTPPSCRARGALTATPT